MVKARMGCKARLTPVLRFVDREREVQLAFRERCLNRMQGIDIGNNDGWKDAKAYLDAFVANDSGKPNVKVFGKIDEGVSEFLASWSAGIPDKDAVVFLHFAGLTESSRRLSHAVRAFVQEMVERLRVDVVKIPSQEKELLELLHQVCKISQDRKIVLVIDGSDFLIDEDDDECCAEKLIDVLPDCCRFVCCTHREVDSSEFNICPPQSLPNCHLKECANLTILNSWRVTEALNVITEKDDFVRAVTNQQDVPLAIVRFFAKTLNNSENCSPETNEDDDSYANESFEEEEEGGEAPEGEVNNQNESLRKPFHRALGYLHISRFGLSEEDLGLLLREATRLEESEVVGDFEGEEEQGEELQSKPVRLLEDSEDESFEDWLMNETAPMQHSKEGSNISPEIIHKLVIFLEGFCLQTKGGRFCIPYNDETLRTMITDEIIQSEEFAPTENHLKRLSKDVSEALSSSVILHQDNDEEDGDAESLNFVLSESTGLSLESRWQLVNLMVRARAKKISQSWIEEYPWLLHQANSLRFSLRKCISDLCIFKLMQSGPYYLQQDLIRFWKSLSSTIPLEGEGPKFDPVSVYARALQAWSANRVDLDSRSQANLALDLCDFFWSFGTLEDETPDYLHPALKEDALKALEIELPHFDTYTISASITLEKTGEKLNTMIQNRQDTVHEQHVVKRTRAISSIQDSTEKARLLSLQRMRTQFLGFVLDQHHQKVEEAQIDTKGYYSYQRWIWMNFPLMALYSVKPPELGRLSESTLQAQLDSFYQRKRQDPQEERPPPPQRLSKALIELDFSVDKKTRKKKKQPRKQECQRKENEKAIKSFELLCTGQGPSLEHVDMLPRNCVPFSSPSVKTICRGTRFPTFETQEKENPNAELVAIFSGGHLDPREMRSFLHSRNGGSAKDKGTITETCNPSPSVLAQSRVVPMNLHEARVVELRVNIANMRKELDELHFQADQREGELEKAMQVVYERVEQDRYTELILNDGEKLVSNLKTRIDQIDEDTIAEEVIGKSLSEILKACKDFPARHEVHLSLMERVVAGMRKEYESLHKELEDTIAFNKRVKHEQIPHLAQALEDGRMMHSEVLQKLFKWRENEKDRRKDQEERSFQREALVAATQEMPLSFDEMQRDFNLPHRQMLISEVLEESLDHRQHEKACDLKRRKAFSQLVRHFGTDNVDEIIERIKETNEKQHELESREKDSFLCLKRLRKVQAQRIGKDLERNDEVINMMLAEEKRKKAKSKARFLQDIVDQVRISLCQGEGDVEANIETLLKGLANQLGCALNSEKETATPEDKKKWKFLFGPAAVRLPPRIDLRNR